MSLFFFHVKNSKQRKTRDSKNWYISNIIVNISTILLAVGIYPLVFFCGALGGCPASSPLLTMVADSVALDARRAIGFFVVFFVFFDLNFFQCPLREG